MAAKNDYTQSVEQKLDKLLLLVKNLENRIDGAEGDTLPSNYRETFHYVENGELKSIRIQARNQYEANEKYVEFLTELVNKKPKAPLLRDFVEGTYKKSFMRKLSPTTAANYNNYLDRYILPVLGDKPMDQITVEDVQRLYDWLANGKKNGLQTDIASGTIDRVGGLLGRLYHIASDLKLVDDCPLKKTLLSNEGQASDHHKALPDEDASNIRKRIPLLKNEQQRLYMGLLVFTGMRREEIAGIGWEHLHLDDGYGEIRRTVVYPDGKQTVVREKTKTKKSTREFIIPDPLIDILKPLKKDSGYIIHGRSDDSPASFSTLRRIYRAAFKELGIDGYDNHDWRATFGTQLKDVGLSSAQVADLMGHADTRMVETTYAPTRHESLMKHKNTLNKIAKTENGSEVAPD